MYVATHNEERDIPTLHALINAHPLGTWVTQGDGELIANHVPFLIDPTRGPNGTLLCHVARANPLWQSFSTSVDSVVIFQGPQAYISPSWYASKRIHGKVVPTWDYAVVHAHGMPRAIEDRDWLLTFVSRLTDTQESTEAQRWKVTDAPHDYIDRLLQRIVGIEIPVSKLIGKWKVNQNSPEADKLGTVNGLMAREDAEAAQVAALVDRFRIRPE